MNSPRFRSSDLAAVTWPAGQSGREAETKELQNVLRRQRWPLVLGAVIGLIAGAAHYATSPKTYYAAATVLVHEQANDAGQELLSALPLMRNETAVLNEMQILRSLQLAEVVVRDLNLHKSETFLSPPSSVARQAVTSLKARVKALLQFVPQETALFGQPSEDQQILGAAALLQREIGISRVGRSFSIEVSMLHSAPELATDIVNSYAENYFGDRQNANALASDRAAAWLGRHIEEVRISAAQAARDADAFRAENRASDIQGLRELEQRAASLNALHTTLLERYEMITIEGSFPVTNGRSLSQALMPRDPALPKLWRLLAAGLILGTVLGLGWAALRELREKGVRTGEDIRTTTRAHFLGYLPEFRLGRLRRLTPINGKTSGAAAFTTSRLLPRGFAAGQKISRGLAKIGLGTGPRHYDPTLFIPALAPESLYSSTLGNVLATIDLNAGDDGTVVAVSSINSGEGRSTLAANLAQRAAIEGHRTLLIDADLQKPGLTRGLGFRNGPGIWDVVNADATLGEAVSVLPFTGLEFLPCTNRAGHALPPSAEQMSRLLDHVRWTYDYVFVDAQPAGVTSDIKAVLSSLDAVVMVADWGQTPRALLSEYFENEKDVARKLAGVVMNRTRVQKLRSYGVELNLRQRSRQTILA